MWLMLLASSGFSILISSISQRVLRRDLLFIGFLAFATATLIWTPSTFGDTLQEVAQLATPLVVGIAAASLSQTELKEVLPEYAWRSLVALWLVGTGALLVESIRELVGVRPWSMSVALLTGVVALSEPRHLRNAHLVWIPSVALVFLSGSRMATLVVLVGITLSVFRFRRWRLLL